MKRDWDVIRQVLAEVEEGNSDNITYGDDKDTLKTGHAFLLRDAGFIDAIDANSHDGRTLISPTLTWAGHDLLDIIRSKNIWERIKSTAKEKGIELTFDAVKTLGKAALNLAIAS